MFYFQLTHDSKFIKSKSSIYLVIIMKVARLEYGLHPFFYSVKDQLYEIILLAHEYDPNVYFTPSKMARVNGTQSRVKITPSFHNPKIVFLKLYGHKIVQSFYLSFSDDKLMKLFWFEALKRFTEQCLD